MRASNGGEDHLKRQSRPDQGRLSILGTASSGHFLASSTAAEVQALSDPPKGYASHKDAALALLKRGGRLTRKAGSFLGQCVVDPTPLTEAQESWFATLLERAELPPLDGGANG